MSVNTSNLLKDLASDVPIEVRNVLLYYLDQIHENINLQHEGAVDSELLRVRTITDINAARSLLAAPAPWSNSTKDLEAKKNAAEITGQDAEGEPLTNEQSAVATTS